jgi:hypothetical protein
MNEDKTTPDYCVWNRCGDFEKRGQKACEKCIYKNIKNNQ